MIKARLTSVSHREKSSTMISKESVYKALSEVEEPELREDLVSLNMIKDLKIHDDKVEFIVQLTTPACPFRSEIEKMAKEAVESIDGVQEVKVMLTSNVPRYSPNLQQTFATSPRNIIAVSSGKGGVGKTTVSVNIALSLCQAGANVGLMDADIYGPNVPMMMGINELPKRSPDRKLIPIEKFGIKLMSVGFISERSAPVIWRGPLVGKMVKEFLTKVEWGDLDYLIVDMPPGTGDAQLTLTQSVALTGSVIVSTPQNVALGDAVKGINMFQKVNVPILGLVENMSYFLCPKCGDSSFVFRHGGGRRISEEFNVPLLGEIPLDSEICDGGDAGVPIVVSRPDSIHAKVFRDISQRLAANISVLNLSKKSGADRIQILESV